MDRPAASSRLVIGQYSEDLVREAASRSLSETGGSATCAFVFVTSDWRAHLPDFLELVQVHAHAPLVVGCSASGLVAGNREVESASGFALLLLRLPGTEVFARRVGAADLEAAGSPADWHRLTGTGPRDVESWIAIADPVTINSETWVREWGAAYPGAPVVGGLASGGAEAEDIFLLQDREIAPGGVIVVGFRGRVRVRPLVTHACRPIGDPLTITSAERNILHTLGSRPAFEVLNAAFNSLPENTRQQAQGNLLAGIAASEYLDDFKQGDFVVRNIIGANPETGDVAIAGFPRIGQTLQYQLRDKETAHADMVARAAEVSGSGQRPLAYLLFTCIGRGNRFFGRPGHDAGLLSQAFGPIPGAGFFCNGEIGPAAGASFLHGHTACAALFVDSQQAGA